MSGAFFEKVVEMRRFFKSQTVRDFRHVPIGVFKKGDGFLHKSFLNYFGRGFAGRFLERAVQMIDVNVKLAGEFIG